jgi:hypothetical protein
VRVINLTTGARALFAADTWLDASRHGSETWRSLPAGPDSVSDHAPVAAQQQQQQQHARPGQLDARVSVFDTAVAAASQQTSPLKLRGWLHGSKAPPPGYRIE